MNIKKSLTIIVTGTPCTGKTTVARAIAARFNFEYIDVNRLIKKCKLYDSYDYDRECFVVDEARLAAGLEKEVKKAGKPLVIDSHLSHYLKPSLVNLCIVTRCSLRALKRRLTRRGYDDKKIRENLDAEIFEVCMNDARHIGHKPVAVDTSKAWRAGLYRAVKRRMRIQMGIQKG